MHGPKNKIKIPDFSSSHRQTKRESITAILLLYVRKFKIILSPLNEGNPTLNIKVQCQKKKISVHSGDHRRFIG